jgi:uncharacterized protein (TIGR02391 family)
MSFWREAPTPEEVLKIEPEELAPFILRYLQKQAPGSINRYNFSLVSDGDFPRQIHQQYAECLMEAWMYLERQGFIAPKPGSLGDWMFVTRRGKKIVESQDFDSYKQSYLLQSDNLDPVLLQKVRQPFVGGDYDNAIFLAFKEVEVRVRKKANLKNADIGVHLMRKAFNIKDGILTDRSLEPGEQVAQMELFAGSIGTYKNPSSHRDVSIDSREAADVIHSANQLLRILDRIPN